MTRRQRTIHALGGPVVFLLLAVIPLPGTPYPVRGSIGLLVWMAWWWMAEPSAPCRHGVSPVIVLALVQHSAVLRRIMPAYAEPLVFLLLGANMLATLWRRWGLDRRIALRVVDGHGHRARGGKSSFGSCVAAVLSSVLPNAVVAASMMPIVLAMLRFIGIEDAGKSAFGSALLIAVAWGTSVGGVGYAARRCAQPAGSAVHRATARRPRVPVHHVGDAAAAADDRLSVASARLHAVSASRRRSERVEGSRAYFAQELRRSGAMSVPSAGAWPSSAAAMLIAFTRQFYASLLPGLTPACRLPEPSRS